MHNTGESVRSPEVLSPPSPEVTADIIFYQRSIHLIPILELILMRTPDSGDAKVINEDVEDAEATHWVTSSEGLVLTDGHVKIGFFQFWWKQTKVGDLLQPVVKLVGDVTRDLHKLVDPKVDF